MLYVFDLISATFYTVTDFPERIARSLENNKHMARDGWMAVYSGNASYLLNPVLKAMPHDN
jgi:3-phenylpropionate/cinnamic acid dioxygenase small subunit